MKFLNLVINIGIFLFKLYVLYFILHFNINRLIIFSICLYIGKEKYETLAKVGKIFALQLANLKNNEIIDNDGTYWPIEFFFSGDWKFTYIIMGRVPHESIRRPLLHKVLAKEKIVFCDYLAM